MDGLTPEQIAENDRIQKLPVIIDLAKGQAQIIDMIKEDKEQNKAQFDEGSEKFKELWDEVKEVRSEVTEMKGQIKSGFDDLSNKFTNHIQETKDNKIEKLTNEIQSKKKRSDGLKDGIIITLVGGVLLVIAVAVLQNFNVNPPTSNQIERIQTNH
ncbi:hypothetical protein KAU11_06650 [Candidatus Babeliales bacterium]|nr:hypothetical protein [Candidatus Babeliales bacterium]